MQAQAPAYIAWRESLQSYASISDETWQGLVDISQFRQLKKNTLLYSAGQVPNSYAFIYRGLIRGYACDEKGNEYNKNFFDEGKYPGAMTALLTSTASLQAFETIEDTLLIEIDFAGFRKLMLAREDLKLFQIHYLEKNWLLAKDAREITLVQEDASERYQRFMAERPELHGRLAQYHIASHLGITPTQLSRIRKNS